MSITPLFSRTASVFLNEGKLREALAICQEGTKAFPGYSTGYLVLGKCFAALGRDAEASQAYRKALEIVPDSRTVQVLAENADQREREAYKNFVERKAQALKDRKGGLTFDQYLAASRPEKESTIEYLLRQLEQAKKIKPAAGETPPQVEPLAGEGTSQRIVTATLAEIYASQGGFREAANAYRRLMEQKPEEASRYEKRLAELEELSKLQKIDSSR